MPHTPALYQWAERVASRLPHLSRPQATVLALWSFGMALARSCALPAVALALAPLLGRPETTARQRLREFYLPAGRKRGPGRAELDPAPCFAPLLAWVLAAWGGRRLAQAIDATTLADRLTVLCASVVYRGCGVPVAWAVLPGNAPGAWLPHWERLLAGLRGRLGPDWAVVVLSDRGLESKRLFEAVTALGWHPLMRVKAGGHFRPAGWHRFWPLRRFAAAPGRRWRGAGEAYKRPAARLAGTLLARWEPGQAEPWLVLTDLPPAAADPAWYALRAWVEHGFKALKSAGWQWHRSRITDPARAARLWLALAVATLWLVEVGGAAEAAVPPETLPPLRRHCVLRRGLALVLAALARGEPLPPGRFVPEDWPRTSQPDDVWDEHDWISENTCPS
jgi:Transposase DDE domain